MGKKGIPHEELLQEFGLSVEDFERMARGKKD